MDMNSILLISYILLQNIRSFGLVLLVSRVAGVAPLRFVREGHGWRVSFSRKFGLYGFVLITFANILTLGTLVWDLLVDPSDSVRMRTPTRRAVWILDAFVMIIIMFSYVIQTPRQMKFMIYCLNRLQKINIELNIPQWQKRETKKYFLLFLQTLITVGLTLVDHGLLTIIIDQDYQLKMILSLMHAAYYVYYWVLQLIIIQLMMMALCIARCFEAINENLRKLIQDLKKTPFNSDKEVLTLKDKRKKSVNSIIDSLGYNGKVISVNSTRPVHETVRRLALTYISLCDLVKIVDKRNGLIIMIILSSILLHLIITPYYLINNIFHRNDNQQRTNMVVQILWCILHFVNLLMLIEPCHLTLEELEVTRVLVSHLFQQTYSPNELLAVELDRFFRHLLLHQVSYSAFRVTTLSRSLVATILGSITTYLVVILNYN